MRLFPVAALGGFGTWLAVGGLEDDTPPARPAVTTAAKTAKSFPDMLVIRSRKPYPHPHDVYKVIEGDVDKPSWNTPAVQSFCRAANPNDCALEQLVRGGEPRCVSYSAEPTAREVFNVKVVYAGPPTQEELCERFGFTDFKTCPTIHVKCNFDLGVK